MTVFYLIRHAHADWVPDEGRPLSPQGRKGAGQVADILRGFSITRICSSPFQRARQTVSPLADVLGLPIHIEADLRERKLGDGLAANAFHAAVKKTWHDPAFAHPGGETNAAAQRRGVAVLQRLREQCPGEHVVLSTHGNLMALVLQHFDPRIDYAFWKKLTMPDIYELRMDGGGVSIARLWQSQG